MGAGWNLQESNAYGIELGSIKERLDRFEQGVEVVVRLLSQEVTDFSGSYFTLTGARCEPKPLQHPHPPLLIGASGRRRTLAIAARWAQKWDGGFNETVGQWREKNDALVGHCERLGREPAEIYRTAHLAWTADADPAQLAEQAAAFTAAGVDQMIFSMRGPYSAGAVELLGEALRKL